EGRKFRNADRGEIEILMRRSTDGGETFSPPFQVAHLGPRLPRNPVLPPGKEGKDMGGPDEQTVHNPVAIATRSGRIHLVYCVEYMRCFIIHSDDDGKTWSPPREITKALNTCRTAIDWQAIATGPGHGIELASKRLIVPVWLADYRPTSTTKGVATTIVSDDGGTTWSTEEISIIGGNEANVVELSNGSVMLTARNGDPRQRRLVSFSDDGGT
ncbi:MAG: exo-alpha-sialidase, partial [Planctomycetaceae bacterium]|nr:exo-alpha-sialidase [Planctomycetaceae bacterium]